MSFLSFDRFIIEAKNTHMTHVEDLMFDGGVNGTRRAINFLRDLRDMLAGHTKEHISTTVKWDGAPAVFAGIDPSDGKFFVAKKGIFNKNPMVYKSVDEVRADTSGDLQTKLVIAFEEFSKLGIKSGVYQGDIMFTSDTLGTEKIDGQTYITFHPNTILYAVPKNSSLGRRIKRSRIGVVWHTTYDGDSFENMSASFGKGIVNKFKDIPSVWQDDAVYRDVSGTASFTEKETEAITKILSEAGRVFNKIPGRLLDAISTNDELRIRMHVYNNSLVRGGHILHPSKRVDGMMSSIYDYYQKKIDSVKTPKGKANWEEKRKRAMSIFSQYSKNDHINIIVLMNLLVDAKNMIVNKMNQASSIGTFLKTKDGFKVTNQEGFVAIDHLSDSAVKIIDRMEFSRANFSPDIIKGFDKRN